MLKRNKRIHQIIVVVLATTLFGVFAPATPISAQRISDESLTISISAGYDGYFRPNFWTPLHIAVDNQGSDLAGRFVVRPETTGVGIPNMFSVPVELPTGTNQSFFLYIVARGNTSKVRVELLNENNEVIDNTVKNEKKT